MFKTELTKILGIKYPIIGGAMNRLSTGEFTAAVSNAGGLGLIAGSSHNREGLAEQIRTCRKLTDKPFGVNTAIISRSPDKIKEDIDVIIEEGVRIVETAAQNSAAYADKIKKAGLIWLHKCAAVRHAQTAERLGANVVTIVGYEGAGHTGPDDLPLTIMIPWAKDTLKVPVVAAGGVADGRALAALLALGADGVQIGTRFMLTKECPGHSKFKQWLLDSQATHTCHVERSFGRPLRVLRNKTVEQVLEMEKKGATIQEILPLISGERSRRVIFEGDIEAGLLACGPAVGLIHDMPSVREVIERIMSQAEEVIKHLHAS